jgi:tetratricopeptide (TPR) repeat protein
MSMMKQQLTWPLQKFYLPREGHIYPVGIAVQRENAFRHSVFLLGSPHQDPSDGAKHLFAKATHALSMTYEASGKYERALEHCRAALALQRENADSEAGTDVAATLVTFGSLYEKTGHLT